MPVCISGGKVMIRLGDQPLIPCPLAQWWAWGNWDMGVNCHTNIKNSDWMKNCQIGEVQCTALEWGQCHILEGNTSPTRTGQALDYLWPLASVPSNPRVNPGNGKAVRKDPTFLSSDDGEVCARLTTAFLFPRFTCQSILYITMRTILIRWKSDHTPSLFKSHAEVPCCIRIKSWSSGLFIADFPEFLPPGPPHQCPNVQMQQFP